MTTNTASTSTVNVAIALTSAPFADRTGQRGRPQKHPQIHFDLSGAPKATEDHGAKKVRLEALAQLRTHLGVDQKVACCEHPKDNTVWILKAECGRQDFLIEVLDAE